MGRYMLGVPTIPFPVEYWALSADWPFGETAVGAYLLSCPERFGVGREGLFPMTAEAISERRPGWSMDRIVRALDGLEDRGFMVRMDGWVLITLVMRYDQPTRGNEARGAVKRLELAPRHSLLWISFMELARELARPLYDALENDAETRPLSKGLGKGLGEGLPETLAEGPNASTDGLVKGLPKGLAEGLGRVSARGFRDTEAPEGVRDTTTKGNQAGGSPHSSAAQTPGRATGGERA